MATTTNFPLYLNHEVQCFNCNSHLANEEGAKSGSAEGDGAYKAYCCKCRMFTFYDVL